MKMNKRVVGLLLMALTTAIPHTAFSEETPPPITQGVSTHLPVGTLPAGAGAGAAAAGGAGATLGIIGVTVSVLGLIALAASSSSGDSTPATTNH